MDIWIQVSFLLILLKLLLLDNAMVTFQIKVRIESSLCSSRCPPPTGPGTRRSLWLWLGSRRPAARTIPSTGEELIGFDMISLTIEESSMRMWLTLTCSVFNLIFSKSGSHLQTLLLLESNVRAEGSVLRRPDQLCSPHLKASWWDLLQVGRVVLVRLVKSNCALQPSLSVLFANFCPRF